MFVKLFICTLCDTCTPIIHRLSVSVSGPLIGPLHVTITDSLRVKELFKVNTVSELRHLVIRRGTSVLLVPNSVVSSGVRTFAACGVTRGLTRLYGDLPCKICTALNGRSLCKRRRPVIRTLHATNIRLLGSRIVHLARRKRTF